MSERRAAWSGMFFFFSSRRRHTRLVSDWSSDVCSSDLPFYELIKAEAVDVLQPDICNAGGITELKKIAAIAESQHLSMAPHNTDSPIGTRSEERRVGKEGRAGRETGEWRERDVERRVAR